MPRAIPDPYLTIGRRCPLAAARLSFCRRGPGEADETARQGLPRVPSTGTRVPDPSTFILGPSSRLPPPASLFDTGPSDPPHSLAPARVELVRGNQTVTKPVKLGVSEPESLRA